MRGLLFVLLFGAAQLNAQNLSFVTCPIVRDTKTVPCWLAEYKGETYYLGNQGGVAQDFYPPQLNHEVLVEGVVAEGPRVCGGIPLRPVKTSVFLEINRACNTILPAEDEIEAPQSPPRPPTGDAVSWVRSDGPADSTLYFDFDNDFLSLHTSTAVQRLAQYFQQSKASEIQITAFRGSSKLSNGDVLIEQRDVAAARAAKVRDILIGLGVPPTALKVQVVSEVRTPDGINDPWSRKVTLSVKPVKAMIPTDAHPPGQAAAPSGPLAGLTVLDLTHALAGPFASFLLAGLGARVIKIENPCAPDPCRQNPPYLGPDGVSLGRKGEDDVSVSALNRLRGKYGVTLNLKKPRGREVFADLVRQADIVVENFSAGTLDRLGIGYAFARSINPRVIYCSISGFGATKTTGTGKAMDSIIQALSGLMMTSGAPGDPPVRVGVPIADLLAPVFAVIGILAALRQREIGGAGQQVDVSMLGRPDVARGGRALRSARGVRPAAAHRPDGAAPDAVRHLRIGRRSCRDLRPIRTVCARSVRRDRAPRVRNRPALCDPGCPGSARR